MTTYPFLSLETPAGLPLGFQAQYYPLITVVFCNSGTWQPRDVLQYNRMHLTLEFAYKYIGLDVTRET